VKTKEEADAILKQLKSGKNFEELVNEKSLDTESKQKGGDLGYVRKEDLPQGFGDTVFKTAKGSIVAEPMKVGEVGFSVIRLDDKRPVEPPKFEKVKDEIYKAISPEYAVKVIESLRKDSGVKKIGLDGKPLAEKTLEQRKAEAEAEAKGEKKPDQPNVDLKTLDDNMVVAEFPDGEKVKIADIKESMATLPPQLREVPFGQVYEPLLTRVVDMKLISSAARKAGLDKDSAVAKKIFDAKNALTQKFFLEKEVSKLITPEMVSGKYQQLLKMIPKNEMEIRLRHILVKTKEEAVKVLKALKSGSSFDEMVKTYSIDEQSKANNGDLGYVRRNELPKEFAEAVFKAPKATLLPEPIQVGEIGFSIVRVEDKRPIEPPKLEEARGEIMKVLSAEQSVKVLEGLRKSLTVKKFDMNGQALPDKLAEPTKQATAVPDKPVAPLETTTPKAAAPAA
jgi:peptidyl-prolyl cis-trans isomerase C